MNTISNLYFGGRRNYRKNPYSITNLRSSLAIALSIFVTIFCHPLNAQTTPGAESLNLEKGVAISGYDAVAYFTLHKAVEGKSTINYNYNGAVYYFVTEADRQLFIKNPAQYLPQYGGWCAYAMATKGEKVEINPTTFKIVNGRLLLFYNRFFNNTLTSWNENEKNFLPQADANWMKIVKK